MLQVNIGSIETFASISREIMQSNNDIYEVCKHRLFQLEQLIDETENEARFSDSLLQAALAAEYVANAAFVSAEAYLASLFCAEAAELASGNLVAAAVTAAEIPSAVHTVTQTREVYEIARKHRELLEQRYEMALKALKLAKAIHEKLQINFNILLIEITDLSVRGCSRVVAATGDITKYLSENEPLQLRKYLESNRSGEKLVKIKFENKVISIIDGDSEFEKWEKYQPEENKPITPDDIRERLNCSVEFQKTLLAFLYSKDAKFNDLVNNYRNQVRNGGDRKDIELKIRKNMVGILGEGIVLHAFKPYGETAVTQNRFVTDDGSYTKTDLIIKKLKIPLIFGRGAGRGAQVGQNLAIEVKCGSPQYLKSQAGHLIFQAQGHQESNASCTICSRDIKNISKETQYLLRGKLNSAGSPLIGMLPQKSDLDRACIEFVFGE